MKKRKIGVEKGRITIEATAELRDHSTAFCYWKG
jgi:hypothetical protein